MYVEVPTDPPPPGEARRLTARPADPRGLGQPRGGGEGSPPPTAPKTVAHPSGSHIGWQRPPCPRASSFAHQRLLWCIRGSNSTVV